MGEVSKALEVEVEKYFEEFLGRVETKAQVFAIFTNQITSIRNGKDAIHIKNLLKKLNDFNFTEENIADAPIEDLFTAYEILQKISLVLRQGNSILEQYNSIDYGLYFNGMRYTTSELKIDWLVKSGSALKIDVEKATNELQKNYLVGRKNFLRKRMQEHYDKYKTFLEKTYNGEDKFNFSNLINKGIIAEAFEEHLKEHHSRSYYNYLKLTESEQYTVLDKMIFAQLKEEFPKEKEPPKTLWADKSGGHENATIGWLHVRHSVGNQRGTVAGDVGNKQIKGEGADLVKFKTIVLGIEKYNKIFDTNIPAKEVGEEIGKYFLEWLFNAQKRGITHALNINSFSGQLGTALDNLVEKNKKMNYYVHI